MNEIKARAEIIFYVDSFDKPEVILTGRWSAKEINKVGALLYKEYRKHLRAIQRGEKLLEEPLNVHTTLDLETEEEEEEKEEVSDARSSR